MPQLDGLKEDLAILKFWLGIVVASFLAIIGWLATNYQQKRIMDYNFIYRSFVYVCIYRIVNQQENEKNHQANL